MSDTIRIIKKYPNRRLYDTEESRYISLPDILGFIHAGKNFKVLDTQSDEDITRSVLIQIIIDQENGENPLFTTDMLQGFIRQYDEGTRVIFSEFLDKNFKLFADQQNIIQNQIDNLTGLDTLSTLTDITQSNLDFWQRMQTNFLRTAGIYPVEKSKKSN